MMIQAADLLATTKTPDRGADPHGDERAPLPLRHLSADPDGDPEGCGRDGEGWEVAMTEMLNKEFSRKSFVKGGGAMIVGFSVVGAGLGAKAAKAATDPYASMGPFDQISVDSWLDRSTPTTRPA